MSMFACFYALSSMLASLVQDFATLDTFSRTSEYRRRQFVPIHPCINHKPSQVKNPNARIEHETSTSKIGEDQLFYFQQREIEFEKAMAAMISGFCRDVFNELPDKFGS
ncbi:putative UPF0051 protein ABCI9 [Quercus lobata]|uniref:putative UPF0051 protein ABCI9 n=1 Tax=Quercus lobata TaxID=97700 RepID=UPI0012480C6F|nr:putative UPF0051 protein ABCI9 [Quercus lobata]